MVHPMPRHAGRDVFVLDPRPNYFGIVLASKYVAGYGPASSLGRFSNLPYIVVRPAQGRRKVARAGKIRQVRKP
jgi:hypothetical protein